MTSTTPANKPTSPPAESGKGKYRAKQSCIPCRTRKVKCDRIKPCQACCVRGLPSECEYVTTNEDRFLISQADAIDNLRSEVGRLRQRLADVNTSSSFSSSSQEPPHSPTQPDDRRHSTPTASSGAAAGPGSSENYAALESRLKVIAAGSPDVVATTVAQLRTGLSPENVAEVVKQLADENPSRDEPGISRLTGYPTPSPTRDDRDYIRAKRLKRETDSDFDTSTDDYSLALRSRPLGQWGASQELASTDDDEDGLYDNQPSLAMVSKDLQPSRKRLRSPPPLAPRISSRHAAMEVFLERFIDAFSPRVEGGWGSSTTLRSAAGIRAFSPILCDALEAVSVTYFGQSTCEPRLESAAYDTYLSVLRNLQHALYNTEQSKSQAILLTVTVLMAFECIQRTTSGSVVNHVLGALRLIEHRGPQRHMYGIEHMFFAEFRPYLASVALVVREPTFLAKEDWKVIPWSAGSSVKDSMQLLLDRVVDIPAFLAEFDKFMQLLNTSATPYAEASASQTMMWTWVAELDRRLREWKRECVDSRPDGPAKEGVSLGNDKFPVFQCRDLDTMEIFTPKPLVYFDLRHAQTMCIYYSAHLVLAAADTRPLGAISSQEQYMFACNICRSMEFYIRTIPGGLINRLAFPLRAAYDALPEGGVERNFVEEVFRLVEGKFKLRLWGSMIPEISTRKLYVTDGQ